MANEDIRRKDLYLQLNQIKQVKDWERACANLGLRVCRGGKHPTTIRRADMPDDWSELSLITVIPTHLYKQMNQHIFKHILRKGEVPEDAIWKALGML